MAAAVGEINRLIRELAPVLNGGTEEDGVEVEAQPAVVSPELAEALAARPIALYRIR